MPCRADRSSSMVREGHQSMNWSISDARFSGIYDPALAAFRSMSGSQAGMTMVSKEANQELNASIGPGTFALTGGPSAGGGVDFTLSEAFTISSETCGSRIRGAVRTSPSR